MGAQQTFHQILTSLLEKQPAQPSRPSVALDFSEEKWVLCCSPLLENPAPQRPIHEPSAHAKYRRVAPSTPETKRRPDSSQIQTAVAPRRPSRYLILSKLSPAEYLAFCCLFSTNETDGKATLLAQDRVDEHQIQRAYRQQAMRWHPDRPKGNGLRFQEILEQYKILKSALSPTVCDT